jgi:hypothetical protein
VLEHAETRCWLDVEGIPGGAEWERRIAETIEVSTHVLYLLSAKSTSFRHVNDEIAWAREKNKILIPILLEAGIEVPFGIHRLNAIDFSGNYSEGLERLLRSIQGVASASTA